MCSYLVRQLESLDTEAMLDVVDSLFREATEGIMIEDHERRVIAINPAMLRILDKKEYEVIGSVSDTLAYTIGQENYDIIDLGIRTDGYWRGELEVASHEDVSRLVWVSVDTILKNDTFSHAVVMVTDISEIKRSRQQLEYIATHDTLTDLPNRVLLYDRLEVSINRVQRSDSLGAVIFLDIDNFKDINDNFGHSYGDELLKICARKLTTSLREKDTVGRLGGDEFLIIIDEFYSLNDIEVVVKKLSSQFDQLVRIHDVEFDLSVSMGISIYPDNGTEVEKLINEADAAMYHVKESGRNNYGFYSHNLSELSQEIFHIGRGVKHALRTDAFYMVYQPQVSLETGQITGVEALLRCSDKQLANTNIEHLISIAEKSSLIIELGKRVMELVCEQVAYWNTLGFPSHIVAVNLSRRQLSDRHLVPMVEEIIARYGVDVSQLEFEITESSLLYSHDLARENVHRLRALGFSFSIDDFGTGYSSLSNLRYFSLDKLKIDRSFITEIKENRHDQIIVEATINMGRSLGLTVLAEGVETEEQARMLRDFGCDEIQGYYFCKAISAKSYELLVAQEETEPIKKGMRKV